MPNVQENDAFACLQYDWGGAYEFEWWPGTDGKTYRALRRDDETELSSKTPEGLRELVRADYLKCPVPRSAIEKTVSDVPPLEA
jgi:hypothetical protein